MELAESQSCEKMPYFVWIIVDIDTTQMIKSHSFTVNDVKFRMVYHQVISKDLYEIYMKPEIEEPELISPAYSIKASISIVMPGKECGDLRFTQKSLSTNPAGEDNRLRHVLWQLRKQDVWYNRDKIVEGRIGMGNLTFLCVFGKLSEYQKDSMDEDTWCEEQCLLNLGRDISKLRLKAMSVRGSILLKCEDRALVANHIILCARSGKFKEMFYNKLSCPNQLEITDMEFNVLENFINYIYTGLLQDDYPSDTLLMQLYKTAFVYKVKRLQNMISFKVLKRMSYSYFFCSCTTVDKGAQSIYQVTENMSEFPHNSHIVIKTVLPCIAYVECREMVSNVFLNILSLADKYDRIFKDRIIFSIATNNRFMLQSTRWSKFSSDDHKLSMEVYDACVKYDNRF